MKPLKVLVYKTLVSAAKAQGNEPEVKPATLISLDPLATEYGIYEQGCVVFESGAIGYEALERIEVLPGQFDTEAIISIDVPGAINTAMDN